jgi:plastocyanin
MRKHLTPAVLVLAVALGLTACSSDSSDSKSSSDTNGSAKAPVTLGGTVNNKGTKDISGDGASTELKAELDNFYIEPTFVKVAAGQKIKIELENEGSVAHTFTSPKLGVDKEVPPGEDATVEVTVPANGNAPFFCRFHRDNGMQGAMFTAAG